MRITYKYLNLFFVLTLVFILVSCQSPRTTGYRTYSLPDKGIVHLSFEYPSAFNVRQVQLYDDTGYERMDIDGPYSRQTRDRTTIWVVAQRYPSPITISDLIQNSISVAEGLAGYAMRDRSTVAVNGGIPAEQYSYFYYAQRTDYETKILGFKPAPTITREVFFSYRDLQWTIGMTADEDMSSIDSIGFEHLLGTLSILP